MSVKTDMHAGIVRAALEARYPAPEWAAFRELRQKMGFGAHRESIRSIDFAAFNTWQSKQGFRAAFEVKVSRGDFLRELDSPEKHAWVEELFHETWFAAPAGLIKPDEVPEKWGLLEVRIDKDGKPKARRAKVAQRRSAPGYGDGSKALGDVTLSVLRSAMAAVDSSRRTAYGLPDGTVVTPEEVSRIVADKCKFMLDKLGRETKAAADARAKADAVAEPLAYLKQRAQEWRMDVGELTSDDVEELIRRAVRAETKNLLREARNAHESLGRLVAAGEAE